LYSHLSDKKKIRKEEEKKKGTDISMNALEKGKKKKREDLKPLNEVLIGKEKKEDTVGKRTKSQQFSTTGEENDSDEKRRKGKKRVNIFVVSLPRERKEK